jgi:hypothetical protein
MDRNELRARQAPRKERYRSEPEALGFEVGGAVHVEGDLDFRGTLGVAKKEGVPVGFTAIRVRFELEHALDEEEFATLLRLTERYFVQQTLVGGVPVAMRF